MRKTRTSSRHRWLIAGLAFTLAAAVLTGGVASAAHMKASGLPKVITIGVLTSCKDAVYAEQVALQDVNKKHFFGPGITVKEIQIDDQANQAGAVTGYRSLVDQKVAGILGPCLSANASTLVQSADANKMPEILSEESAVDLVDHKYVFRGAAPQRIFAKNTIKVLHAKGYKSVAVIWTSDQSDTAALWTDAFQPTIAKYDMKVLGNYPVSQTTLSIASVIAQIQQLNPQPDIIGLDAFGTVALPYLNQIRQAGLTQPIFGQIVDDYAFIANTDVAHSAGGLIYATNFSPDSTKAATAFTAAYTAQFQVPPDAGSAQEYDGAWRLFRAIKSANSVNHVAIQKALEAQKSAIGLEGKIVYSQHGHEANSPGFVYWLKSSGKIRQVIPKN